MRSLFALSIFILALRCEQLTFETNYTRSELPHFEINLDLEPEERFKETTIHFKDQVEWIKNVYVGLIPDGVLDMFEKLEPFVKAQQRERYLEIKGIADVLEIEMSEALELNYLYELQAFCTSIVTKETDGTIIHSRNLDFAFSDHMRDITYVAHFTKEGEEVFQAVMFAGLIGVFTGIKNEGFSISENDRRTPVTKDKIFENIELMFKGYNDVSWVLRDTLEQCDDFQCALNQLSTQDLITPAYYILAGTKDFEGAVISRDRFGSAHIEMLSSDRWYLIQTNDDHFDGTCQIRCQIAHKRMKDIGIENMSRDKLREEILLQAPNLNEESIFNSVMVPKEGLHDSIGVDCDFPWFD